MKKIEVELSRQGLRDLSKKIDNLKQDLKKADKRIEDRLADYARTQIENNLSATPFRDGNEDTTTFKEEFDDKIKVGMRGSQVLYNEFGTGTQGEMSPHPVKGKFPLHGYNTGRTIRTASLKVNEKYGVSVGTKYWTYKSADGQTVFTTGIPAGKQVFDAAMALRKEKKKIVKQEVSDVLSKL